MMKRMSFSETIFLFVLALVVFGPKKLPEIARQIGKALNEFRRASNEFKAQIEHEISNLEVESKKQATLPPSPAPEGTASRTLGAASSGTSDAQASASESTPVEVSPVPATLAATIEERAKHAVEPATEALPATENSEPQLAIAGHSASDHPALDHSAPDHSVARFSADHSSADHSSADLSSANQPSVESPSVDSPAPNHSEHAASDLHDSESVTTPTTQESHA
jgi:sec-independent protein translocase protein TatB